VWFDFKTRTMAMGVCNYGWSNDASEAR
jgi:hypothetical protein